MANKPIKPKEYQKIPVTPEDYASVRLIADANGLNMGGQVAAWVKRDLPQCGHKKQAVQIEYMRSEGYLAGGFASRTAWYCPTCKRVYARLDDAGLVPVLCDGGGQA